MTKKEDDDLMKFAIQRSSEKQPPLRNETDSERIERYMFLFENGDKPKHYDDPLINKIDSFGDYGKLRDKAADMQDNSNLKKGKPVSKEFIRDAYPKKFDHHDKSTYLSTGKPQAKIAVWDLIKQTAKTPFEKKEIREILHREYKKDKTRLEPDELRMIGKSPEQLKALAATVALPIKTYKPLPIITPEVPQDTKSLDQRIFENSRKKPGLSEDLLSEQIAINKNMEYVFGKKDEDQKARNQKEEAEDDGTVVTIGETNA